MDKNLHAVGKESRSPEGHGPTTNESTETRTGADSWKYEFLTHLGSGIRTSMDAIVENTDLALRTDLNKEQRDYLETVRTSVESLLSQFNDILDFSNIYTHGLELENIDFDLNNTLENTAEMLAVKAQDAGLELEYQMEPDVPSLVTGDPGRLRQIIVSITQTVIRSTQEGKVIIRLEKKEWKEPSALLHFAILGTNVGRSIDKTTGSPESPEPIVDFNPQKYGDSDPGLTFSKQLIGMMGGQMWVEKRLGKGPVFHFTARLNLSLSQAENTPEASELVIYGVPVLIVDDNEINRFVFHQMAFSWGLVPTEAADGKEAIEKIKKSFENGTPFRLILMDFQMPGMDGFEVAKIVKEDACGTDVKIILLTSVGQKGDATQCKTAGISGYLVKPVNKSDLLDAIIMVLMQPHEYKEAPLITRYTLQEARRRERGRSCRTSINF